MRNTPIRTSPDKTKRSSTFSRPIQLRPRSRRSLNQHPATVVGHIILDLLLITLALYFIQEGRAQLAKPNVAFFTDFPTDLLPLAYASVGLLITNMALTFFIILRKLRIRRWPWVTTAISVLLLSVIFFKLGAHDVWVIINPQAK